MHKYVVSGPQGCGKGTQSELLCRESGYALDSRSPNI